MEAQGRAQASAEEKLWTPANVVTLVRICLVPVFVVAILSPWPQYLDFWPEAEQFKPWVAALVFVLIAATDALDGYLARSRGEVTNFGKFLDPLADKILVAAALLALIELGVLPSWPAIIILAREFIVSGLRMVAASHGEVIAASWYGKAKTATQIIAIVLFIVKGDIDWTSATSVDVALYAVSWFVMAVALVLTVLSMLDYLAKSRHLLGFGGGKGSTGGSPAAGSASEVGSASTGAAADVASVGVLAPAPDSASSSSPASAFASQGSYAELKDRVAEAAREVVEEAGAARVTVGTAESLTGGMIAAALTSVPGSSSVVRGGVVSYVNEVKNGVLGVDAAELAAHGAVTELTARQMAEGACLTLGVDLAVAVTGIAGPGGAEEGKPVGTVWIGACRAGHAATARCCHFEGDRASVRLQTTHAALSTLVALMGE